MKESEYQFKRIGDQYQLTDVVVMSGDELRGLRDNHERTIANIVSNMSQLEQQMESLKKTKAFHESKLKQVEKFMKSVSLPSFAELKKKKEEEMKSVALQTYTEIMAEHPNIAEKYAAGDQNMLTRATKLIADKIGESAIPHVIMGVVKENLNKTIQNETTGETSGEDEPTKDPEPETKSE